MDLAVLMGAKSILRSVLVGVLASVAVLYLVCSDTRPLQHKWKWSFSRCMRGSRCLAMSMRSCARKALCCTI
jgi:hypothetical protein